MNLADVVKYPVSTEKGIRLMEAENKLIFVIHDRATKGDVKQALESRFSMKVAKVRTYVVKGKKRAYVKLAPETSAIDIATQFGMM